MQGKMEKVAFSWEVDYLFRMVYNYVKESGNPPVLVHGTHSALPISLGVIMKTRRFRRSLDEQHPLRQGRDAGERSWR